MLLSSSDEEIGALIENYKENVDNFEKNLMSIHIKSDGHLSLNDVYNMTYKMRQLYIEAHNDFTEELNKKSKI